MIPALVALLLATGPPPPATAAEIVAYHDSGAWAADLDRVVRRARRHVSRHRDTPRRAIVLDIDDTALSNYTCLKAVDFDRAAADCAAGGDLPAVPQTRRLYRFALRRDVTVFFITGRRRHARSTTVANLRAAGYTGRLRLWMRPDHQAKGRYDGWKARTRKGIERRGYRIVANVGDQRSDLDGGAALRAFKLPNPMYVIRRA